MDTTTEDTLEEVHSKIATARRLLMALPMADEAEDAIQFLDRALDAVIALKPRPADDEALENFVNVSPPSPEWGIHHWTVLGDFGSISNYTAQEEIQRLLANGDLVKRVRFDSEAGCFFAYTDTEEDARMLAAFCNVWARKNGA